MIEEVSEDTDNGEYSVHCPASIGDIDESMPDSDILQSPEHFTRCAAGKVKKMKATQPPWSWSSVSSSRYKGT